MQQNRRLSVLKKQKRYYSRKEKRHTLKTQLLISHQTGEIIALAFSNGKKHDFQLFKDSRIHVKAETVLPTEYRIPGPRSDTYQFSTAEKAFQELSLAQAGA